MRGPVGNIIHAQYDLAGQLPLESKIPLVNVGVSRRRRAQVVIVAVPPVRQCPILLVLRTGETGGKRILQGRRLGRKIGIGKEHRGVLSESSSGILEVRGRAHSEIYASPAAH